jgi:hypothetical protein
MDPIAAINGGDVEAIERILEKNYDSDAGAFLKEYIAEIAKSCNLAVFRWAIRSRKMMTVEHWHSCIDSAAREGRLYLICMLHKYCNDTRVLDSFGLRAASEAATYDRVNVIEWLEKKECMDDIAIMSVIEAGTYNNNAQVLKFVRKIIEYWELDVKFVGTVWDAVLQHGIHDFIDVMFDHMYGYDMEDFTEDCAYLAEIAKLDTEDAEISFGHAECLRYLRSKGFPWNPDEATRARAAAIGIA